MENQELEQVMWPRVLAKKLLVRPVGGDGLIADYPTAEKLFEITGVHDILPAKSSKDLRSKYRVFVSTWNVGGVIPQDDLNLDDWLHTTNNKYDIYVLGFQEIVPLNAKNVLGPEKIKISTKWNSLIRATLNKSSWNFDKAHEDQKLAEKQKVHPVKDGNNSRQSEFQCLLSKQMVGILISVWVRGNLRPHVRHLTTSSVGCGIMGYLGNKGSVSVRFLLHETSFCFVCCHLASGGKEGDEVNRNSDALQIFSRTRFPPGPRRNLPKKILDHDRVILLGDLNYRISLPECKTRCLVESKNWKTLLENDQLRSEVENGAFGGWQEGEITFSPTYKYYPNSDKYYGCINQKKGEKKRSPAWCDRILWHGKGITLHRYNRNETKLSDHRPVHAIFTADIEALESTNNKSLVSFFLSERFEAKKNDLRNIGISSAPF